MHWRAVRARQQRPALIPRTIVVGRRILLRTETNGRSREPGIGARFVRAVLEPDIADHDRIAGHDLAFVGRAVADHPLEPVGETDRSARKHHRAGQYQAFHGLLPAC